MADPLLLTLQFDPDSFALFDGLRRRHFPAKLNRVPAHITLFHHLPSEEHAAITRHLTELCAQQAPLPLAITGVRFLGKGVAYEVQSPELTALRAALAAHWYGYLTPQDRQRYKPHITVQNKVPPDEARTLYERLDAEFRPFTATGTGLHLWWYRGGPWQPAGEYPFGTP